MARMINLTNKAFSALRRVYSAWITIRTFDSDPLADLSLLEEGLAPRTNSSDS